MIPKRITIHCSDSPNGRFVSVEEIRRWHLARGFSDIGYHYVISPDGTILNGRPITEKGAHVLGENTDNVGICMNGRTLFSMAQFRSLRSLLDVLCNKYGISRDEIFGHYEFPSAKQQGKTCPNMDAAILRKWFVDQNESLIQKYILDGDA